MRKTFVLFLTLLVTLAGKLKADEGMWLLPLIEKLNIEKMQQMGLKLSAEDIYSVNQASLKDAVVIFGRGCTGELISDKGLILTNHHCGYGQIQALSTVENNHLENGFWALSLQEEIPAPGLTVTFLKRMEDVTARVVEGLNDQMSFDQRQEHIRKVSAEIASEAKGDTHYQTFVRDYFAGNQFFLVVYEVFNDVRFVGAPPSSIGKFGYDTDNWMWPRHTGDFSLFRVYAGKDGKPAAYSPENVPYKPAHHLPVSLKGFEKDDFAMTIGFPGSTDRYLTSWGIDERMNIFNYSLIKVRGIKQDIWSEAMAASDKVRLQYASKFASSSNYWKNSIGMNRGLEALDVPAKKKEIEKEFDAWLKADQARNKKYGNVLSSLEAAYTGRKETYLASNFLRECLIRGTEALSFATIARELEEALKAKDKDEIAKATETLRMAGASFFKDYSAPTDRKVMAAMLKTYANEISPVWHPSLYQTINKNFKGNYEAYAGNLFTKSFFVNEDAFNAFLAKPNLKKLQADPAFIAGNSVREVSLKLADANRDADKKIADANRLFIVGLMEMQPDRVFYPDANFTMRLSYGTVGDYEPRDAVIYKHFTTLKGVMEKEVPNNFEFIVPNKLKELYKAGDYGRYAAADGNLYVNYTTNNDITGGNSGSPVINGNGELVGLAFDGNWEAMSGDIAFEPDLQKCINVDIRYVLFIIDKYAGALNLIEEMTLVE